MAGADLAVIDLTQDSDNVAWKRDRALPLLPKNPVIVMHAVRSSASHDMDCIDDQLPPKGRHQLRRAPKKDDRR